MQLRPALRVLAPLAGATAVAAVLMRNSAESRPDASPQPTERDSGATREQLLDRIQDGPGPIAGVEASLLADTALRTGGDPIELNDRYQHVFDRSVNAEALTPTMQQAAILAAGTHQLGVDVHDGVRALHSINETSRSDARIESRAAAMLALGMVAADLTPEAALEQFDESAPARLESDRAAHVATELSGGKLDMTPIAAYAIERHIETEKWLAETT